MNLEELHSAILDLKPFERIIIYDDTNRIFKPIARSVAAIEKNGKEYHIINGSFHKTTSAKKAIRLATMILPNIAISRFEKIDLRSN